MMKRFLFIFSLWLLWGCQPEKPAVDTSNFDANDPAFLHGTVKKLTDVIVYDIFSPPVSSRIYAYTSLAAYEAIRFADPEHYPSFVGRLKGFDTIPTPQAGKRYSFPLAGLKAFMTVAQKITFSVDTLKVYEQGLLGQYAATLDTETYQRSVAFGEHMGKAILSRAAHDKYKETRGMSRYTVTKHIDKWQPTPPDYADAVEPHWQDIPPLALDSAGQCMAPKPMPCTVQKNSAFYKEMMLVYETGKTLTEEQKEIARFWDDNSFVSHHTGHATFASKKMTPAGHWMALAALAAKQTKANLLKSAQSYALTSVALFDGFISCWEEKYRSQYVRPISVIRQNVDENWESYLQTPPFPEYTSGHSVISNAAATVLTHQFGDSLAFIDTSEEEYGMGKRSFTSFFDAAQEAALSRLYGGIHYKFTCEVSADQGKRVGQHVLKTVSEPKQLALSPN